MFIFEAREINERLTNKIIASLGMDEAIIRIAYIEDKKSLIEYGSRYDYDNNVRSREPLDITEISIDYKYSVNYNGYTEMYSVGVFMYNDKVIRGTYIIHDHENGDTEYFLNFSIAR